MGTLLRKSTPVLVVERIEPVIPFWTKLGVLPTTQVPDEAATDGRLAFVILACEGIEIMYQTLASVQADLVKLSIVKEAFPSTPQQTCLFVEVSRLAEVEEKLKGERLVMPRRTTFYGMAETGYAEPCGNLVIFAEPLQATPDTH
jgi:hypothetical protein